MNEKLIGLLICLMAMPIGSAAQSAYPEPDLREPLGDWLLECYGTESRNGNCQMYHRVLMNNATQIALVLSVAYTRDGAGPFMQLALPLGSDINSGAQLSFGSAFNQNVPFTRCTDQGCLIEGQITETLLGAMRIASVGTVGVVTEAGAINIPISMAGFASGMDRLKPTSEATPDTQLAPVTSKN